MEAASRNPYVHYADVTSFVYHLIQYVNEILNISMWKLDFAIITITRYNYHLSLESMPPLLLHLRISLKIHSEKFK